MRGQILESNDKIFPYVLVTKWQRLSHNAYEISGKAFTLSIGFLRNQTKLFKGTCFATDDNSFMFVSSAISERSSVNYSRFLQMPQPPVYYSEDSKSHYIFLEGREICLQDICDDAFDSNTYPQTELFGDFKYRLNFQARKNKIRIYDDINVVSEKDSYEEISNVLDLSLPCPSTYIKIFHQRAFYEYSNSMPSKNNYSEIIPGFDLWFKHETDKELIKVLLK